MLAFHFNCVPRKVKEMGFHFGNLSSRYGANNLYFTKDGRPFLPIAGELHFSRTLEEHERAVAIYAPLWKAYDEERGM